MVEGLGLERVVCGVCRAAGSSRARTTGGADLYLKTLDALDPLDPLRPRTHPVDGQCTRADPGRSTGADLHSEPLVASSGVVGVSQVDVEGRARHRGSRGPGDDL